MLDKIISIDKNLLIYLNSLGSATFDPFWQLITKQANWTPFFVLIFYILYQKLPLRHRFHRTAHIGLRPKRQPIQAHLSTTSSLQRPTNQQHHKSSKTK